MSTELRIALIVISILALLYIVRKIRHSKMNISDSIFWIVFALLLLLISIFPQIIYFFAGILQIQSPQNFIFLFVIAILILKVFLMTIRVSQMQDKLTILTQKIAIDDFENRKKNDPEVKL